MDRRVLALVALVMLVFIFVNEVYHTTKFIIKYYNVKETAKLNKMACDNLHTEAETERFQICTNMYDLLMPNDSFNCKTYTIFVLIFAIILFLYVADLYVSYLFESIQNYNSLYFYITVLFIHFIIFLIANIGLRYVPYDEKGYLNSYKYGDNSNMTAYYSSLYVLLGSVIIAFGIYFEGNKMFIKSDNLLQNVGFYLFLSILYILALHFLYLLIVIVEAFKINTVPWDLSSTEKDAEKYWTADISYDSENFFYYKYMKLNELMNGTPSIFDNPLTTEWGNAGNYKAWKHPLNYGIHDSFIAKNLRLHNISLIAFICLMILIVFVIFVYFNVTNRLNEFSNLLYNYIIPICYPIIILFILLFVIIYTTDYNTAINKHILLDRNAVYKYDLMKLNNVITPYIYMYNNYTDAGGNRKNYLYNYIVFNVLISYFTNYINVFNNAYKGSPATHKYLDKLDDNFRNDTYFSNYNKQFSMINDNDLINEGKFKEYYSKVFELIFEKGLSTNMSKEDIKSGYVEAILENIFAGDTDSSIGSQVQLLDSSSGLKISDISDATINNLILTPASGNSLTAVFTTFQNYDTNTNIKNIMINIYRLFKLFQEFNDKIGDYNNKTSTLRNNLLQHMQFYIQDDDKDNNCIPYRFILKKPFILPSGQISGFGTLSVEDYNTYHQEYGAKLKRTINIFILHILSLYQDYKTLIAPTAPTAPTAPPISDIDYVNHFNNSVVPTFNVMLDTQTSIEKKYNNNKLMYLYYALNKFEVVMKTNENYLKYLITNNAYKLTDEKYDVKLVDTKQDGVDFLTIIDSETQNKEKVNYANGKQMETIFNTYTNTFLNYKDKHKKISDNACKTSSDIWQTYIIDMFLIYIVYKLTTVDLGT